MIRKFSFAAALLLSLSCSAQKPGLISSAEATRIETYLASDELAGRRPGTPGMEKAATFIADEMRKAGLKPLPGASGYLQEFSVLRPKMTLLKAEVNGADFDTRNVIVITTKKEFKVNEKSGFAVKRITPADAADSRALGRAAQKLAGSKEPTIVLVDTSFASSFGRLTGLKRSLFSNASDIVFLLAPEIPASFSVKAEHSFEDLKMANVVGMLPGKDRAAEQVIFSGHYDHLGIGKPVNGDSIYNGANDDASGITSMLLLAQHFAKQKNNSRTLLFAAFTAEESGGFGATYFSRQLDPEKVMAMFNIEMVGTESKWGRNSAYITGFEKSSFGTILQAALKGTGFEFHPDPYTEQNLFYRSDNATLARLGVPAHTISTSKMDVEPHYHKPSDEVKTLDMDNLAMVTEAIAKSAATIISGKETPTRVKE
ncbi:M20/M25/M40 family metallo-hydrolase [Flaviaesturariibacter flavus]|uniref:M20/M25/M40 family metallo-hydrolase n=1 Tax=Flaviaesturariibacter flavus TaxID=2502780 RepID=A0A4R1BBN4_9BACT|nr:M28 family peptidase [Flaviaesturariibacter flavus]TCJ14348.1 M20/M25/M40 family metallo-hydrolase [Flaviaesturariibacter flavus]